MGKYVAVMKTEFQRQLTFRASFLGFRIGNFLEIFMQIIVWSIIFQKTSSVSGYTYPEMMTYVVFGWTFSFLTSHYGFEDNIARQIQMGELSNFIIKPINYVNYIIALSFGRVTVATGTAFIMNIVIIIFFSGKFAISYNFFAWLIVLGMIFLGYFIKLFLSTLVGFIAFWTVDVSGIFFSIKAFERIMSGSYFPVNLLSATFVNICLSLPFVYTFFYPVQLFMGKLSVRQGLIGLGVESIWLVILYFSVKFVWKKGLNKYESLGI